MKYCKRCQKTLAEELFYTDKTKKDGLSSRCKDCVRAESRASHHNPKNPSGRKKRRDTWVTRNKEKIMDYQRVYRAKHREKVRIYNRNYMRIKSQKHRLDKYGIDDATFISMMERQKGSCGMCARIFGEGIAPQIDHCHKTGKVRGLLCLNCNIRLGYFESEVFHAQATKYLGVNTLKSWIKSLD